MPIPCSFEFSHSYEVRALESYSLAHPLEKVHHFPVELEEGDRTGVWLRVAPIGRPAWIGFFALGFASDQVAHGVFSVPDPQSLCVVAGGYGYFVKAGDPGSWSQAEQRPVVSVMPVPDLKRLLLFGFTSISAYGEAGHLWTTPRLSWEGISNSRIEGDTLFGTGWDALKDKDVEFNVNLVTGACRGGARPQG
jgi:hypothetical protein